MNVAYTQHIDEINSQPINFTALEKFIQLQAKISSAMLNGCMLGDAETMLLNDGHDVFRTLLQENIDKVSSVEERLKSVTGLDGIKRTHVRQNVKRSITSVFGKVTISRYTYAWGHKNKVSEKESYPTIAPLDCALGLPDNNRYSFKLQQQIVCESMKSSFESAVSSIPKYFPNAHVGKRQAEEIVQYSSMHFDGFYDEKKASKARDTDNSTTDPIIMSCDGKGIAMINRDLREQTKKAANKNKSTFESKRLSSGEKKNRKRMATVATVYEQKPFPRTPESIAYKSENVAVLVPKLKNKRVFASIEKSVKSVVSDMFSEAKSRDPSNTRERIVLVDGNKTQIDAIEAEAISRKMPVTIIIDFIHVLEYVWMAAFSIFEKNDPKAESWVKGKMYQILLGKASTVARSILQSATKRGLTKNKRENIDKCAGYLKKYASFMRYDEALAKGYPIATGVIEGACRHLIKDRFGITGAKWSLVGAEAMLKHRSMNSSGDYEGYWDHHVKNSVKSSKNMVKSHSCGR